MSETPVTSAAPDAAPGSCADPAEQPALSTRWMELAVAAFLLALGCLVIADSLRVGVSWADDGPQAGYFPFFIGSGLALASAAILLGQLRQWRTDRRVFATRAQAHGVRAMLVPIGVYVLSIAGIAIDLPSPWPMLLERLVVSVPGLGLYLPSAALIAYFMRRHGAYAWWKCASVALATPVLVFVVFERWFTVPLPKGPIERWLGF